MSDGEQFQIQLSSNSSDYLCLQFFWNGKRELNQLVLRPFQHVFLDRFIDSKSKLTFKTYQTTATEGQTKDLGTLKIVAYIGRFQQPVVAPLPIYIPSNWNPPYINTTTPIWQDYNITSTTYDTHTNLCITGSCISNTSANINCYNMTNCVGDKIYDSTPKNRNIKLAKKLLHDTPQVRQTGTVEHGKKSETDLVEMNIINTYKKIQEIEYKILPQSARTLYQASEIKIYCSGCGRRKRQKQNFCPACGRKF